jgi:lipid-binding SYLF domain-containing protein
MPARAPRAGLNGGESTARSAPSHGRADSAAAPQRLQCRSIHPEVTMMRTKLLLSIMALALAGCMAAGQTKEDKRRHIENMRKEVLTELYRINPDAAQEIKSAPGYAVFSNWNAYLIFASVGQGYGVVVDNVSGAHTYMGMGALGGGLGAGVKDYRAVYIFDKRHIMERFVEQGLNIGGTADATAKASTQGEAVGGELLLDGIKVYQMTSSGLALQATIQGTKFFKDPELN